MKSTNNLEMNAYQKICLQQIVKNAPELIDMISKNKDKQKSDLRLMVNLAEGEEVRTTIRINKNIWGRFNDFSRKVPYNQKDLLSTALNEFLQKYSKMEEIIEWEIIDELKNFSNKFKDKSFSLETISDLIVFIRKNQNILEPEQIKILLDIPIHVLKNEVHFEKTTNVFSEGRYFSGNMFEGNDELKIIKQKFYDENFTLEDFIYILESVKDSFINSFQAIEFMLRNPEVIIRDNLVLINFEKFKQNGKLYYDLIQKTIDNLMAQRNQVLYDIVHKQYNIPYIHEYEIEKYYITTLSGEKEVCIHRPEELNTIHLLLAGGSSNYPRVRTLLAQNGIYGDFNDKYLDEIYYYLNKIEMEYREIGKNILRTLGLK